MSDERSQNRLDRLADRSSLKRSENPHTYTRFVSILRWLMPLSVVVILAALFLWPMFESQYGNSYIPEVSSSEGTGQEIDPSQVQNQLLDATFEDVDDKGRPYIVGAKKAIQSQTNQNIVLLESPYGEMDIDEETSLQVKAAQGRYHQLEQKLTLFGQIALSLSDGSKAETAELTVNAKSGEAMTETPVSIQTPDMFLTAENGLHVTNFGDEAVFRGPVLIRVDMKEDQTIFGRGSAE